MICKATPRTAGSGFGSYLSLTGEGAAQIAVVLHPRDGLVDAVGAEIEEAAPFPT
jgi:hypothetical protein